MVERRLRLVKGLPIYSHSQASGNDGHSVEYDLLAKIFTRLGILNAGGQSMMEDTTRTAMGEVMKLRSLYRLIWVCREIFECEGGWVFVG